MLRGRLLTSLNVQFWKTANSWRLDRSYRRGHCRDIPSRVDAANVHTVRAQAKTPRLNE